MGRGAFLGQGLVASARDQRRLETDEDIAWLLQQHFPLVDDLAARDELVAAFARRHELRARKRRARLVRRAIVLLLGLAMIALAWPLLRPRLERAVRRLRA